jgi:hypothetical protein
MCLNFPADFEYRNCVENTDNASPSFPQQMEYSTLSEAQTVFFLASGLWVAGEAVVTAAM